jgi:hypothetical protein
VPSAHTGPRMDSPADTLPLERHAQLIACEGAGKTEAVSRRVIEQLHRPGVAPANGAHEDAGLELGDITCTDGDRRVTFETGA